MCTTECKRSLETRDRQLAKATINCNTRALYPFQYDPEVPLIARHTTFPKEQPKVPQRFIEDVPSFTVHWNEYGWFSFLPVDGNHQTPQGRKPVKSDVPFERAGALEPIPCNIPAHPALTRQRGGAPGSMPQLEKQGLRSHSI